METYMIAYLIFNTIWCSWYAIHAANRSDNMPWWGELLIAIIPAIITGIITLIVARKSQLNKNTDKIKELKESNEKAFNAIKEDIGRGGLSSLTEQHKSLENEITRDFSDIKHRFEKDDAAYSKFSRQQLDADGALKFFIEDYKRLIAENNDMHAKIIKLESKIEALQEDIQKHEGKDYSQKNKLSR